LIAVMFWILALSLAVAAALIIILPLLRADGAVVPGRLNDAEVYRDQLREV
jgi:cytochrome c-type biogenesis protein CcmI